MHAVGDVADRDLVERAVGPERVPHLAGDLAVAARDAVGGAAQAQRELGDADGLALGVGVRPREPEDVAAGRAQLVDDRADRLLEQLDRVGVVARRDRRVRREDRARARGLDRLVGGHAGGDRLARELERRERGVALVHVDHAGVDAEPAEQPHPADAEQDVLGEPGRLVADVQARRDPALHLRVVGAVDVEQVERHAADVDAPDLGGDVLARDRDGERQDVAVVVGDERGGGPLGVGRDPVLVLPAARVDALAEVALLVHQADRDERQRAVRGLLDEVAGERAEPARVDRQRLVDAVLGAEEGDRMRRVDVVRRERLRELLAHDRLEQRGAFDQPVVGGGALEGRLRHLGQQPHRVLQRQLPARRVDRAVQLVPARQPAPAVVVGQPGQRCERLGQPLGQFLGRTFDVQCSISHSP